MSLTTYASLQAAIATRAIRTDLGPLIPDFIVLTEAQMNRRLRVRRMIGRATASLTDEYSAVPTDFMGVRTFSIGGPHQLRYLTPDQMDTAVQGRASGSPAYYTIVGGEFRYYPTSSVTATLTYWKRIPALSDAQPVNWLLTDHPDAYLYGALLQVALHTRNEERASTYGGLFSLALDAIDAADWAESDGELTALPSGGYCP